jgi:FkbM family methyltransferase
MLNPAMGTASVIDGRSCLTTAKGQAGHAVYGPYEYLEPGDYVVEFSMALNDAAPSNRDFCCAVLDIAVDGAQRIVASKNILLSQLRDGRRFFTVPFTLTQASRTEYRVAVTGKAALVIDGHRSLVRVSDGADGEALLANRRFPEAEGAAVPFFRENQAGLRSLYEQGVGVGVRDGDVVLTVNGISLYARCSDDVRFIGEVFFENAYNFGFSADVCAIDIGMNIGLSSLLFASKAEVAEVHSFEPFVTTYDRAVANLGLNPAIAGKVTAHNLGLSNIDRDGPVVVSQSADSGAMSTVGAASGEAVEVSLRDAGTFLQPIIDAAHAAGRKVVVKVDCEGSEFPIFESLVANGLIPKITAFMVEWHAMFAAKTQNHLIAPLRAAGFLVFDRSPPAGNGFFYAVRTGGETA